MFPRAVIFLALLTLGRANFFSLSSIATYVKYFYPGNLTTVTTGNELWSGILKDCSKKLTFSCIQKNTYTYLDNTLVERDNITVFDGFTLRKNNLDYESCRKNCHDNVKENLIDDNNLDDSEESERFYNDNKTPLEEITTALRDKTVKFLATRDYEIELPNFFFESSNIKISPREIDENGALIRIDFGQRDIERAQGRLFKKLRKFIQNRLLMSFLALLLIIKLIKVKFMFIIPFLFGIGTAKKLFLKLLLFFVPAFAHVFKLCSSYYSSKYHHHHHHQIAHHHHHVPVPVPVPTYIESPSSHHFSHHDEEFNGYDYAHPHLQIRKDMEELKEWGIDTYAEPYDEVGLRPVHAAPPPPPPPPSPSYPSTSYGVPQYPIIKTNAALPPGPLPTNVASHGQTLAYSAYADDPKLHRRVSIQNPFAATSSVKQNLVNGIASTSQLKSTPHPVFIANTQTQRATQHQIVQKSGQAPIATTNQVIHDDTFYGPIVQRLEDIFAQLRFIEEPCRERLICSMYKNPEMYSPHSNLVSNELSRDPQELKRATSGSASSQRFLRYVNAARLGQEGGDCLRTYPCKINTE